MNTCPDCKCEFVQPFRCATCGAQKLYDHTVTSQQQTIDALRARVAEQAKLLRSAVEWLDVIEASAPELRGLIAKIRASGLPDRATEERKGTF